MRLVPEKVFICYTRDLKYTKYFVKWVEDWKDELIVYIDKSDTIKSSLQFVLILAVK